MLVFLSNVGGNFKSFDHGIITHTHMFLCYLMDVIDVWLFYEQNDRLELNNDYRSDRYGFCRANISHASVHTMACSPLYSTVERTPNLNFNQTINASYGNQAFNI